MVVSDFGHEGVGGFVCVRCGMSARERVEFKMNRGLDAVCIGRKRQSDSTHTRAWYKELWEKSFNAHKAPPEDNDASHRQGAD